MKRIDSKLLNSITDSARVNPRLRQHHNIHESYDEPCQRLLNAMEPGSYIQPHRHLLCPKIELFFVVRGLMALIIFSDDGAITNIHPLSATGDTVGMEIPPGVWHSLVSLEKGSVFLEVKPGPFEPLTGKDRAPWAPAEGTAEAARYLDELTAMATNAMEIVQICLTA